MSIAKSKVSLPLSFKRKWDFNIFHSKNFLKFSKQHNNFTLHPSLLMKIIFIDK